MKIKKVIIIVAHPDDECLGCGGTIAKLASEGCLVDLLVMTNGVSARRDAKSKDIETRKLSALKASKLLGVNNVNLLDLPDNELDTVPFLNIVKAIEEHINHKKYETLITHFSNDMNIDHKLTCKAALTASRPQPMQTIRTILTFETPSSTDYRSNSFGTPFNPNYFVDISTFFDLKIKALSCYKEEIREFPHSRSIKAIESLSISRGASVGLNYAEAFMLERHIG
jgi:N-acetylglucosamine malate deacetylase 1